MASHTAHALSLAERSQACIWRPFTQEQTAQPPLAIARGEGAYLIDQEGNRYLDAISSWWTTLHGHAHPHIAARISEQAQRLEQAIFADCTHEPAVELAERLTALMPEGLTRLFFADNGSTAVETALKIAIQYAYNKNSRQPRTRVIAFEGGYHGDTIGAMSVSDGNLFTRPFAPLLFDIARIPAPTLGREEESLQRLNQELASGNVACFIFEPLLQGVGGMQIHTARGLDALIAACRTQGVLTIADEVLTGFGRLGPLFASSTLTHPPDLICLAKGLTGGFVPMGAVLVHERIYKGFLSDSRHAALLHGHSFCGNPIGCAAALASLDLLLTAACTQQRERIAAQHLSFVETCRHHPTLLNCRSIGTILALEYRTPDGGSSYFNTLRDTLLRYFRSHQVIMRPFGNMIHVLPPYCIEPADLERVYSLIHDSLEWVYAHI